MSVPLSTSSRPLTQDAERLARLRRGVWRFLRFLGAPSGQADDLTQEAFVRLLSAPLEDRGDAAVSSWLRQTAHNLFRATNRRLRSEVATLTAPELEDAWVRLTRPDPSADLHMDALERCLEGLDDRSRTALRLRHGEGVDRRAIAARLGVAVEGAKTLLRRARERLRVCMRRRLEETDGR